jgi:predicted O-methyltransferase YrrM
MNNPVKYLQQRLRIRRRQAQHQALRQHRVAAVRQVYAAIAQTVNDQFDRSERVWMDRIEAIRDHILADQQTTVSAIDYGAGQPTAARSIHQSDQGVAYTRSIAEICQQGNVSRFERNLLFALVRHTQPDRAIELGTSLGFSASYQAAALEMNGHGHLVTLDGDEAVTRIAAGHFQQLHLADRARIVVGRFRDTLGDALQREQPIDFAFVDGHHDGEATIGYFKQLMPFLSEHAVLVFDDIQWYESMQRAWVWLQHCPQVVVAIELDVVGICVYSRAAVRPRSYRLSQLATAENPLGKS